MDFINELVALDKELLIYLNAQGTETWDGFWLVITNQFSWIPLYLLFFYFIFKYYGWKNGLALMLFMALMVTFSDQLTVFIKDSVGRLRPNRDPSINEIIRILKNNKSFSFVSGHATTSMAVSLWMHLRLRKHVKYTYLFFIWPLLFSYSRMYIGVHFPLDVFCGTLLGILIGVSFYRLSDHLLSYLERRSNNQ